eukprot:4370434-Pyramimonas_sp.AAC.1
MRAPLSCAPPAPPRLRMVPRAHSPEHPAPSHANIGRRDRHHSGTSGRVAPQICPAWRRAPGSAPIRAPQSRAPS